jgi:repressor LexA
MKNGDLDNKEFKGLFFINDSVVYKGKSPSLAEIAEHLGFASRRSSSLLLERLENKGYIKRTEGGNIVILKGLDSKDQSERTIELPLVGNIACGIPLLAEENIEAMIPVSQKIARPGANYFILRANGDSMNKVIKNGDLAIIRQQPVAENGQIVAALIDNKATLKEFHRTGNHIILRPKSTKEEFKDIIMDENFFIQGVVVSIISNSK